jgi:hypothetical protein
MCPWPLAWSPRKWESSSSGLVGGLELTEPMFWKGAGTQLFPWVASELCLCVRGFVVPLCGSPYSAGHLSVGTAGWERPRL